MRFKKLALIIGFIMVSGVLAAEEPILLTSDDLEVNGIRTKASINITVNRKLDESELTKFAKDIYKTIGASKFKRFFIMWYLPGMKKDTGAWATTNFDPILKVEIMDWMLEYNPTTID